MCRRSDDTSPLSSCSRDGQESGMGGCGRGRTKKKGVNERFSFRFLYQSFYPNDSMSVSSVCRINQYIHFLIPTHRFLYEPIRFYVGSLQQHECSVESDGDRRSTNKGTGRRVRLILSV